MATPKGGLTNAGHTLGDGDTGQVTATREGRAADTGHAGGDNCVHTTCNQRVSACLYDGIAIITRIVVCILCLNTNGGQAAATREGRAADAGHAGGDGDGGQAAATREGRAADAGHAGGNGDGGQATATREGIVTNASHSVSRAIISDRTRYNKST